MSTLEALHELRRMATDEREVFALRFLTTGHEYTFCEPCAMFVLYPHDVRPSRLTWPTRVPDVQVRSAGRGKCRSLACLAL